MDSLDLQLIGLLRTDARASVATLAGKLGVSRGTVTNRIKRLEDDGLIVGYTVRLRPDAQPNQITAWMSIAVEGNQTRAVIATLLGEPGVAQLHDTNGRGAGTRAVDQGHRRHRNQHSFADLQAGLIRCRLQRRTSPPSFVMRGNASDQGTRPHSQQPASRRCRPWSAHPSL
jgi:DNA-binding Lrp family transcriptional regulator